MDTHHPLIIQDVLVLKLLQYKIRSALIPMVIYVLLIYLQMAFIVTLNLCTHFMSKGHKGLKCFANVKGILVESCHEAVSFTLLPSNFFIAIAQSVTCTVTYLVLRKHTASGCVERNP